MQLTPQSMPVYRELQTLLTSVHTHIGWWIEMAPPLSESGLEESQVWRDRLQVVAKAARSVGLLAYASLCLRVAEQLEPAFRGNRLPRSAMQLLWQWSRCSLRYLDLAANGDHSIELVAVLDLTPLAGLFGEHERAMLVSGLIEDRTRLARGNKSEATARSRRRRAR
jgi:hypothetical protein